MQSPNYFPGPIDFLGDFTFNTSFIRRILDHHSRSPAFLASVSTSSSNTGPSTTDGVSEPARRVSIEAVDRMRRRCCSLSDCARTSQPLRSVSGLSVGFPEPLCATPSIHGQYSMCSLATSNASYTLTSPLSLGLYIHRPNRRKQAPQPARPAAPSETVSQPKRARAMAAWLTGGSGVSCRGALFSFSLSGFGVSGCASVCISDVGLSGLVNPFGNVRMISSKSSDAGGCMEPFSGSLPPICTRFR